MSRKHKHKHHKSAVVTPADLRARVVRLKGEGRFQQALELTKQLYKQEPTPAHLELLKEVYLGRARQLRGQGYDRDALTVLEVAQRLDEANPAWLGQLAAELALCGEAGRAMALLERFPDLPGADRIRGQAADAALQREAAGRTLLPASLQPDFDRVLQAFRQVEAGQDEEARATLQALGLRSPFLEWKLLLRGLQAYYQNDDVRALENWQRLAPERLPARLVAPFRYQIDPAYRTAQPPATQAVLQKQIDRLQGSSLLPQLRSLRTALDDPESLAPAFRLAEALLPALRLEAPHMVPRLASCFYWAAVETGPDDVLRYQRAFGSPPHDPHFHRLRALAYERAADLTEAHQHWQLYEKEVAAHPDLWPGGQADRARALIWLRMGENATRIPGPKRVARMPAFLRDHPSRPRPLNPPAEECFTHALELAPDQIEPYEALFHYHRDEQEDDKAARAAERLLKHFPDHVATLEELGDLRLRQKHYDAALGLLQRALRANPLDRKLRAKVSTAHVYRARSQVEAGRFDVARQDYQAALALSDGQDTSVILSRWAGCEFKAGATERAEELLQQVRAQADSQLLVAYTMLIEAIRLKLPRPLKTRFDAEFKAGLEAPPTGAAAAGLVSLTAALQRWDVTYHGQKTHTKKVLAYLDKARTAADFTDKQLDTACSALLALESFRKLRQLTALGRRQFPNEPSFPYLEALSYFQQNPDYLPMWEVRHLLEEAERLARAKPVDERWKDMLDDIQKKRHALDMLNPFSSFMQSFFDNMFDGDDEFFDGEDDDDDYW